jgi:mannose-6-phosphate isomerase-like protein (cupin superfamily)
MTFEASASSFEKMVPWCPYTRTWLTDHPDLAGRVAIDWSDAPSTRTAAAARLATNAGDNAMESKSTAGAWVGDIEDATLTNSAFRTVLFTGAHTQLTVMALQAGEEIGWETHSHIDQFIRIEQGQARVDLGSENGTATEQHELADDWALIIPAGLWHNVVNIGNGMLKLYSLYSPAEHPAGTVHATKADADAAEHDH